jgi:NTP pyrophosphatase (non-canonical NTP hydrolase)
MKCNVCGNNMIETQQSISTWQLETFGHATNLRKATRVAEEVIELIKDLAYSDTHSKAASEVADILIVLYGVAEGLGVDIYEEVDKKMAINRARKWKLDGTGCGYHE